MALALLIQVFGAELLRVTRAELEDIANLDRPLSEEWCATTWATESRLGRGDIGHDVRLIVTSRVGVEQVPADTVGTCDEVRRISHRLIDNDDRIAHTD